MVAALGAAAYESERLVPKRHPTQKANNCCTSGALSAKWLVPAVGNLPHCPVRSLLGIVAGGPGAVLRQRGRAGLRLGRVSGSDDASPGRTQPAPSGPATWR
jgi:hypothetical protein